MWLPRVETYLTTRKPRREFALSSEFEASLGSLKLTVDEFITWRIKDEAWC
jgi:hypothetical protein